MAAARNGAGGEEVDQPGADQQEEVTPVPVAVKQERANDEED